MDIAVIGAGNMGCVYGANMARAGYAVTMVDRSPEHVDAMAQRGLMMEGVHGSYTARVRATTDPTKAAKADVALITVNNYETPAAAASARTVLKDEGYALTLQNGMGHVEVLTAALGEGRVMGGLTFHSGDLRGPGRVTHTNEGSTYLGELDRRSTPRLAALAEAMKRADMQPAIEPDIIATMWNKFVLNCGINAVCAVTDLRPGHLRGVPEVDAFQTRIIEEVLALVKAKGIALPDPDPLATIKAYCATKFHRVSMVQHLSRGRRTEIDSLNGYVARESRKMGLEAPYNDALAMAIKGLERSHQMPAESRDAPVAEAGRATTDGHR